MIYFIWACDVNVMQERVKEGHLHTKFEDRTFEGLAKFGYNVFGV